MLAQPALYALIQLEIKPSVKYNKLVLSAIPPPDNSGVKYAPQKLNSSERRGMPI